LSNEFEDLAEDEKSWAKFEMNAFDASSSSEKDDESGFVSIQGDGENNDESGFTSIQGDGKNNDESGFASFQGDVGGRDDAGFASIQGNSGFGNDAGFTAIQGDGGDFDGFTSFEERVGDTRIIKKAEKTLIQAQETAALVEREAYEKGFEQGEKDGSELGEKKALKVLENIEKLLEEIGHMRTEILKQCEKEVLEIIFVIGKKIIHHQLESDEEAIKGTLHHAVQLAAEKNKITLRVNPEDFDYVERLRPEFFTKFKELKSMTVTSDPSITRGGCLLETPYGDVDARIETQFDMIHQSLESAYMERGDD